MRGIALTLESTIVTIAAIIILSLLVINLRSNTGRIVYTSGIGNAGADIITAYGYYLYVDGVYSQAIKDATSIILNIFNPDSIYINVSIYNMNYESIKTMNMGNPSLAKILDRIIYRGLFISYKYKYDKKDDVLKILPYIVDINASGG